jgi:D-arabinose 1-dehydrogenase-like Zn-dependent alcohol dehydrogenase
VQIGYAAGTRTGFDIFDAIRRGTTIHAGNAGSRRSFEALVRAIELHGLRPAVDRTFPVSRIGDAFACLAEGGYFGKIVLTF